jgi:hypothetical protein
MTTLRKAAQAALEALEWSWGGEPMGSKETEAITLLRSALAAPEPTQEPVVWANIRNIESDHRLGIVGVHEVRTHKVDGYYDTPLYARPAPPQEPVAWASTDLFTSKFQTETVVKLTRNKSDQYGFATPLYARPPQTQATDEYRAALRRVFFLDHNEREWQSLEECQEYARRECDRIDRLLAIGPARGE